MTTYLPESATAPSGGLKGWIAAMWRTPGVPPLLPPTLLLFIQIVGTHFAAQNARDRQPLDALAWVLVAAGPLALLARQRHSVAVLWFVAGVTLAYLLVGYPYGPVFLSLIVALYWAVTTGHRLAAWSAAATLYVVHFGLRAVLNIDTEPTLAEMAGVAAWMTVVLAVSEVARARHESVVEAQQAREEEARRRASEERLRIARELHDVLAHHISLINVQSGVALHLMGKQPEQARTALTAIEQASRDALSELRSVLDLLRQPEEGAPLSPAAGLTRLSSLTSQASAAGLEIETRIEGERRPLPASTDAAAFRIVQEALTNVVRHAAARNATVLIRYGADDLEVQVDDDGSGIGRNGERDPGGGSGIKGMRERVLALGGHFYAGPSPEGHGFRVSARLPVEAEP